MKRLLLILALLIPSAFAASTWTENVKPNIACTSGSATCVVSLSPAVGAGNLLNIAVWLAPADGAITLSSITGDTCSLVISVRAVNATAGTIDTGYCLSAVGGESSITVTMSAAPTADYEIEIDYASSGVPPYYLDASGETSHGSANPQSGIAFTLHGANDIIFQSIRLGGGTISTPYINESYSINTNHSTQASADLLNTTTGSAPSWTLSGNEVASVAGLAFSDSSGGGAKIAGRVKITGQVKVQ